MNTKVKVGIAAAIVAALVALIVLDQKTAPTPGTGTPAGPESGGVTLSPVPGSDPVRTDRDNQVQDLIRKAREQFTSSPSGPLRRIETAPETNPTPTPQTTPTTRPGHQ